MAEGLVTHIDRTPVDPALAAEQHAAYVAALAGAGWTIREVPPAEDLPDSAFIEDTMVVCDGLAVLSRPGAEERRAEVPGAEEVVRELGLEIARIEAPGTLDGGDVLQIGDTVYVGRGGRTNGEGIRQLRAHLAGRGRTVVPVPLHSVLHLKSAVTALPDGTVVGYRSLVDDPGVWDSFLAVPEESGSHVVLLGGDTVLMSDDAPESRRLFEERGLDVVAVDISEFIKLEGCVTCLSVRLRHSP
jgi:dimethylargininase